MKDLVRPCIAESSSCVWRCQLCRPQRLSLPRSTGAVLCVKSNISKRTLLCKIYGVLCYVTTIICIKSFIPFIHQRIVTERTEVCFPVSNAVLHRKWNRLLLWQRKCWGWCKGNSYQIWVTALQLNLQTPHIHLLRRAPREGGSACYYYPGIWGGWGEAGWGLFPWLRLYCLNLEQMCWWISELESCAPRAVVQSTRAAEAGPGARFCTPLVARVLLGMNQHRAVH